MSNSKHLQDRQKVLKLRRKKYQKKKKSRVVTSSSAVVRPGQASWCRAERQAEKKRESGDTLHSTHSTNHSRSSQAATSAEKKHGADREEPNAGRTVSSTSDQEKEKTAQDSIQKTQDKISASWNLSHIVSLSNGGNVQDVELQSSKTEIKPEPEETLDIRSEDRKTAESEVEGGKALVFMSDTRKSFEQKPDGDNTHNVRFKDFTDQIRRRPNS
ncbi:uncharacterized protein LOC144056529 [Vanacampus margaritifer]